MHGPPTLGRSVIEPHRCIVYDRLHLLPGQQIIGVIDLGDVIEAVNWAISTIPVTTQAICASLRITVTGRSSLKLPSMLPIVYHNPSIPTIPRD